MYFGTFIVPSKKKQLEPATAEKSHLSEYRVSSLDQDCSWLSLLIFPLSLSASNPRGKSRWHSTYSRSGPPLPFKSSAQGRFLCYLGQWSPLDQLTVAREAGSHVHTVGGKAHVPWGRESLRLAWTEFCSIEHCRLLSPYSPLPWPSHPAPTPPPLWFSSLAFLHFLSLSLSLFIYFFLFSFFFFSLSLSLISSTYSDFLWRSI